MGYNFVSTAALAAAMAFAVASSAQAAPNLIVNGGFEQSSYTKNTQFSWGGAYASDGVTGWTGGNGYQVYFIGGTETTVDAANAFDSWGQRFYSSFDALSSNGGNFVALDGDQTIPAGSISQTLDGLKIGQIYALTFDWAAGQFVERSGDITEQFKVTFGDETQFTEILQVASGGFSGWRTVTMNFTASAVTQTLTFFSLGTPTGLPPVAVLDGVSLTAVPESSTWAMMLVGFGALGASLRYRRGKMVAA